MAEVIGKCPSCAGNVVETNKAYSCSNWPEDKGACKFAIWKTICKKAITKNQAKQLLEKSQTDVIKGFVSRKDTKFDAALKLEQVEDGKYKTSFIFN